MHLRRRILYRCARCVALVGAVLVVSLSVVHRLYFASVLATSPCKGIAPSPFDCSSLYHKGFNIDVVSTAAKPTCANRDAIVALNRMLNPRIIHIAAPSTSRCTVFANLAPNVNCFVEDNLVPGVSKEFVTQHLQHLLNADSSAYFSGRELAGWYFQQLLKLGSAISIENLTENYLIWDLDMIPLRPVRLFTQDGRAVRHIGGRVNQGYSESFQRLTGLPALGGHDGSSFVTHCMLVHKPYMIEFLNAISQGQAMSPRKWAYALLKSIGERTQMLGFSEYVSYGSWVQHKHPETVALQKSANWRRYPSKGRTGIRLASWTQQNGLCCPPQYYCWYRMRQGMEFVGWEITHGCDTGKADSYGLADVGSTL